jgi:hypothetical protein
MANIIFIAMISGGIELGFSGGNLNPERLLFVIFLLMYIFFGKDKLSENFHIPVFLLSIYLLIAFVSSLFSDVAGWALKMTVSLFCAISYFYFVAKNSKTVLGFNYRIYFYLCCVIMGPVSCGVYFLNYISIDIPLITEKWLQFDSAGVRVRALIYEANIYGCIVGFILLSLIAKSKKSILDKFNLIFLFIALVLSGSRGPWLAFIFSLVLYYLLIGRRKINLIGIIDYSAIVAVVLFVCVGIIQVFFYEQIEESVSRVNTVEARIVMWDLAFNNVKENFLMGNGVFSFSELFPDAPLYVGSETYRSAWISNIFLAIVHDTGVIGAIVFFGTLFYMISSSFFVLRFVIDNNILMPDFVKTFAALISYSCGLFVSGLTIPTHSIAFFWIVFGVMFVYKERIQAEIVIFMRGGYGKAN